MLNVLGAPGRLKSTFVCVYVYMCVCVCVRVSEFSRPRGTESKMCALSENVDIYTYIFECTSERNFAYHERTSFIIRKPADEYAHTHKTRIQINVISRSHHHLLPHAYFIFVCALSSVCSNFAFYSNSKP